MALGKSLIARSKVRESLAIAPHNCSMGVIRECELPGVVFSETAPSAFGPPLNLGAASGVLIAGILRYEAFKERETGGRIVAPLKEFGH